MSRAICPACGLTMGKRVLAMFLTSEGALQPQAVCQRCIARGVTLVAPDTHRDIRAVLLPFAQHLRKLAQVYELQDESRAEGLKQAADILESGRAVDVTGPAAPRDTKADDFHTKRHKLRQSKPQVAETVRDACGLLSPKSPPARPVGHRDQKPSNGPLGRCALAILHVVQSGPRSRTEAAIRSGYSPTSGGFNQALALLRERGLVTGEGSRMYLTDAGHHEIASEPKAPRLFYGEELMAYWVEKVGTCAGTILEVIVTAHPAELSRDELSSRTGYSGTSGGFNAALAKLRSLELVVGMHASDALVEAVTSDAPERRKGDSETRPELHS